MINRGSELGSGSQAGSVHAHGPGLRYARTAAPIGVVKGRGAQKEPVFLSDGSSQVSPGGGVC